MSFHAMLNDLDYYACYQIVIFDWAHESAMRIILIEEKIFG